MTPDLNANRLDITVAGLKSLTSVIPYAGGAIAEILGQVIPGQRLDRVCAFLEELEARLKRLEVTNGVSDDPAFVDLFEDAVLQSLRAMSKERLARLAHFVSDAAQAGAPNYDVDKRLLSILGELTDTDLEVLRSHLDLGYTRLQQRFYCEPLAHGPYNALSDQEKNDYDARRLAWDVHVAALVRFGLLAPEGRVIGPQRNDFELDEGTGLPRVTGHRLSPLGHLLLRRIGSLDTLKQATDD